MMMPSTMILTICISVVLKHNRGHWVSLRESRTQNS